METNQSYWPRTDVDTKAVRDKSLSALLRCAEQRLPYKDTLATVAGAISPFVPNDVELSVKLKRTHTWFDSDGSGNLHVANSVKDKEWRLMVSLTEFKGQSPFNLYVFSHPLPRKGRWWVSVWPFTDDEKQHFQKCLRDVVDACEAERVDLSTTLHRIKLRAQEICPLGAMIGEPEYANSSECFFMSVKRTDDSAPFGFHHYMMVSHKIAWWMPVCQS